MALGLQGVFRQPYKEAKSNTNEGTHIEQRKAHFCLLRGSVVVEEILAAVQFRQGHFLALLPAKFGLLPLFLRCSMQK